MAQEGSTRPIPPADREREQIAVRYSERQRQFGYGGEPAPVEPHIYPVYLSFREVVGWIAYRQITALEGDTPDTARFFERWKHKTMWGGSDVERRHSLVHAMRRVIARVRWWQRSKRQRRASTAAHLRPLDRIARSHVRWAIRRHGGTADSTLGLLRADVRQLLAAEAAHDATISRARQHLWAEMAAEKIVALGRPGIWRKRQFKSAMHEPIPAIFCANPHNTIRLDGWATCADSAPAEEWVSWSGRNGAT